MDNGAGRKSLSAVIVVVTKTTRDNKEIKELHIYRGGWLVKKPVEVPVTLPTKLKFWQRKLLSEGYSVEIQYLTTF